MHLDKLIKISRRFFTWLALVVCSSTIRFLPWQCLYTFARNVSKIGFLVASKQRRIALESLSIAFGREKSPQELRNIAKDCFIFIVTSALEIFFFKERPQLVKQRVVLENKHILEAALSRGKGVILVSGHLGNFPLGLLKLTLEGYSVNAIMRPMRDQRVEKIFSKLRNDLGIKMIYSHPRKACVDTTIRVLKNNGIIVFELDQNFGTGGVFVDFFGRKAATATGPVVFALRTKAVILPCFIIRQEDNRHKLIFEPEFNLIQGDSLDKTVLLNIQGLTEIIESYIRRYPVQWAWIHRRWKTRPKMSNEDISYGAKRT